MNQTGPRRTPLERELNLLVESEMYLKGKTLLAIAERLSLSVSQVHYDVGALMRRWRDQAFLNIDELKGVELARLNHVEATAWESWAESKQPRVSTSTEQSEPRVPVDAPAGLKAAASLLGKHQASVRRETPSTGDGRFLEIVLKCIDARIKLLGLAEPQTVRVLDMHVEAGRIAAKYSLDADEVLREAAAILEQMGEGGDR